MQFADLKGAMELLAGHDPEEACHLFDPVIEHMMDDVYRYEGMVNQVLGPAGLGCYDDARGDTL